MTYSKHIIITLCLYISFIACKNDECHDLAFQDQYLDPVSSSFQSWKGIQSFIFKDSLGGEHIYSLSTSVEQLHNSLNTGFCEDTTRMISFLTEYFLKRYTSSNQTAIAFAQFVDFVEQEQDLSEMNLVDKIGLSIFNDSIPSPDPISRIILMTSPRESLKDDLAYNDANANFHDSLMIMNKMFYDVFEQKNGIPKLYYTMEKGVVSLTDNRGTKLILERTE